MTRPDDNQPPPEGEPTPGEAKKVVRPKGRVKVQVRPGLMLYALWRMGVRLLIVLTVLLVIGALYVARWLQ